jgi:hypothetical protein
MAGSTYAIESASKASKKVAVPTMMRVRICQDDSGSRSMRARMSSGIAAVGSNSDGQSGGPRAGSIGSAGMSESLRDAGLIEDFLAVCRDLVDRGTTTGLSLIGLYQISWLPLPVRTNRQPCSRRIFTSSR